MNGPPFSVTRSDVDALYGAGYDIAELPGGEAQSMNKLFLLTKK